MIFASQLNAAATMVCITAFALPCPGPVLAQDNKRSTDATVVPSAKLQSRQQARLARQYCRQVLATTK
jgi:hypothetical protein